MSASAGELPQNAGIERRLPLAGLILVWKQERRGKRGRRDLPGMLLTLTALLAIAAALQAHWLTPGRYANDVPRFLARWLTTEMAGATLLFLPIAAILGARSVPTKAQASSTQSALLTRLTAFDIVVGRLIAGLWSLVGSIVLSLAFWLAAQAVWHPISGEHGGVASIFLAHFALVCAVFMPGAIGFLFALRRRPGRAWGRGAGIALLTAAFCFGALFLANGRIQRMENPTPLINATLFVNPVCAITSALHLDILRTPWIYEHTAAPEFDFTYPPPIAAALGYAGIGLTACLLSAWRLRRAFR